VLHLVAALRQLTFSLPQELNTVCITVGCANGVFRSQTARPVCECE